MSKLIQAVGLFTFVFCLNLYAQSETLSEIQVLGTKDPVSFSFGAYSHTSKDELEERSVPQITPIIESIPGVISNQNGGPGSRVSFFIRGTESRHVSFALDGLKLNDVSNIDRQFDAAFLSSPILSELTVFKGPQAVLFGSDALGGLIDLRTRKGESPGQTRLSFHGGSFGTVGAALSSDWKVALNQGTLTYSHNHSDGLSRLNKKRFNAKEQDSSDISQATSSSRHRWDKNQTDLLVSFINGKNELDGATTDNSNDSSINHQYLLQQKTSHFLSKTAAVSLRTGLNRHQRFIDTLVSGDESFAGNLYQNEVLLEKKSSQFEITGGVSSEHEAAEASGLDRQFDLYSLFLQNLLKIDKLSFQFGGRFENHSRYGNFETGSVGTSYGDKSQNLFLQYSQGFKAPSVYQLFVPLFGNSNLVPERNNSWETGWVINRDSFGGGVTLFQNRLSNLITFTADRYQNQGDFITEGVEVEGRYSYSVFIFKPSFVHQNFRKEETEVLRRPQNMASLQASWFARPSLEVYSKLRWYAARKDIDPDGSIVKLNSFENLDFGMQYRQGVHIFSAQVINILNREYEEIYGFSVMPRSLFAGYSRNFSL